MGFITLVAAVAGIIWGMLLALRGSLIPLVGIYLVVGAVFGFEWFHFDLAGVSLSVDRLLLLGIVAGFVLQRRLQGNGPEDNLGGSPVRILPTWETTSLETQHGIYLPSFPKLCPTDWVLVSFFVWLVGSTFLHDWRRSDPDQEPILPHLVEGYVIPVLLYTIVRGTKLTPRSLQSLYTVLSLFGIYLAVTAILEVLGIWSLVYPKYIANPLLGIHFGRARGPFLQSVRLGIYLLSALSMVWVTYIWQARRGKEGQLLGMACSALFVVAVFVTYTRSIWMALAVAIAVIVAWTFQGGYRRAALFALITAAVLIVPLKDSVIEMKREYGAQETAESTKMRAVFAYVSWLMFQDHPLSGVGFGHFPHEKEAYLNDRQTNLRLYSIHGYVHHNSWLSLLTELGLPGMGLFAALIVMWGRRAWMVWHQPQFPVWIRGHALVTMVVICTVALQMLFHETSYSPFENSILFVCAGLMTPRLPGQET
jgi:O-Antigen ligase